MNKTELLKKGKILSLSKGNILDKKQLCIYYFGIVIWCCFPVLTLILTVIPQVEWDAQLTALIIGCDISSFALLSLWIYIKLKNNKLIKNIRLWLKDAIIIDAYSKKIGEIRLGLQPKGTKIQVEFAIGAKKYKRQSTVKVFGGKEGYVGWFNKYADRNVKILYSTKYDEVMIIKD